MPYKLEDYVPEVYIQEILGWFGEIEPKKKSRDETISLLTPEIVRLLGQNETPESIAEMMNRKHKIVRIGEIIKIGIENNVLKREKKAASEGERRGRKKKTAQPESAEAAKAPEKSEAHAESKDGTGITDAKPAQAEREPEKKEPEKGTFVIEDFDGEI